MPVAVCPICNLAFDERAFQLVVPGVGAFDSVECVEEARRRDRHHARVELMDELLASVEDSVDGREKGGGAEAPAVSAD